MSPYDSAAKMPEVKKPKVEARKPEWPRRACPEAIIIKPVEGVSYTDNLKFLKKRVKPDELGIIVNGIKETRSKDLLIELKFSKELLKATHIKIWWVSFRVHRKMEVNRCYRCLAFGHMAANCWGPDRSRSF